MSEVLDKYFYFDDGMPDIASDVESNSTKERSWGEAFSDVTGGVLSGLVKGDKVAAVAGGIEAALNTDDFQARKQRRARASRMAELELQDAENRVQANAFKLEQAKALAPLQMQQAQANLANIERQGRNSDQQFEQNKELFPLKKQSAKAAADLNTLRLQQAQYTFWDQEAANQNKLLQEQMNNRFGYQLMDDAGRAVMDNSQALQGLREATIIMNAIKADPEKAKYYAQKKGWTYNLNDKEEDTLTSPDGKIRFTANDAGLKKLMDNIQKQAMDDITAARIIGTDAQSIPEASAKVMLNNQNYLKLYGTVGNAYRSYRDFMNQKVLQKDGSMKDLFTPSQKMVHATSVTLNAALKDNAFSQAEMAALSAQFVPTVKQFGGEVIWGQGVDDTKVIMRNNGMVRTYPIREFAEVLSQRDVITPAFNRHVAEVARKMNRNQAGGQGGNNAARGTSNIVWKSRLDGMYGTDFRDAKDTVQDKLVEVAKEMDIEEKDLMQETGAKTMDDLSLDNLRMLDNEWKNKVDDDKFYSPYQDRIFLRERDALYKEKAPLIAKLRELGKNTSDYQEHIHGRRGQNQKHREIYSLRKKIDRINDGIKMRESKLRSRGVKFKEYN